MQTARIIVLTVVEFRACVKLGEHDFHTADFEFGVFIHRHAAPVVADSCDVVVQKFYTHGIAVAVCGFVDTVVDDFPKYVVHTFAARRTDVHTGAFSHGIETFQDSNVACFVFLICHKVNLYKVIMYL